MNVATSSSPNAKVVHVFSSLASFYLKTRVDKQILSVVLLNSVV